MTNTMNQTSQSCTGSRTPETDAAIEQALQAYGWVRLIEVSRKLELQRDAAIALLEEYGLQYSDHELEILASCRNGMGEILPTNAQREIKRRKLINEIKNQSN